MHALLHVSLISGPVPSGLTVTAFACLALSLVRRGVRWWVGVVALAVAAVAVVVTSARIVDVTHRVDNGFPWSFFAWTALPLFALGTAIAGWRRAAVWRRCACVASVVLMAAFGADTINAFYAYRPTLGDALGAPMPDELHAHSTLVSEQRVIPDHGSLVTVDIPATVRFAPRDALVWLPPAFTADPSASWPVLMLLAGVPGAPADMVRAGGAAQIADAYAAAHGGVAPLLVMPDHNGGMFRDTECVDGPRGAAESYLANDVRAFMQQHYAAATDPRQWAVVGYSEGGTCALGLSLRRPDAFGAFVDIGGDLAPNAVSGRFSRIRTVQSLYGGRVGEYRKHDPVWLARRDPQRASLFAVFADGRADRRHYLDGRILNVEMHRVGVPSRFEAFAGGHNFRMVHSALTALLPDVADYVSLRPTTADET